MSDYYTLITKYGLNKIVYARSQNLPVKLSKITVGDGEIVPSEDMTSLKSPKHTVNINEIRQDETNRNYLILTGVIPADVGGFYINEIGVLDDENKLFAIGNIAKTYKPLLSEGSAKEVIIEVVIEVANASEVTINIDGSIVLATREYVKNEIKNIYVKLQNYYTKKECDDKFALKSGSYTKAQINSLLDKKQNLTDVYTKKQSDERFSAKNDSYTKAQINSLINEKADLSKLKIISGMTAGYRKNWNAFINPFDNRCIGVIIFKSTSNYFGDITVINNAQKTGFSGEYYYVTSVGNKERSIYHSYRYVAIGY